MTDIFDKNKIIEYIFDPDVSEILSELETEGKESSYLAEKFQISEDALRERLSYLLEHDFVKEIKKNNKIIYEADKEKLAKIMESDGNFDNAIDGLTKIDSYLN